MRMAQHIRPQPGLFIGRAVTALLVLAAGLAAAPATAAQNSPELAPPAPANALVNASLGFSPATGCSLPGSVEGVDVSAFQGQVNWAQVAQTKAFAYARAGDGSAYVDPSFVTNYGGIKSAGLKAGAYFFFEPSQDPVLQANHFVNQLVKAGVTTGDLLPMFVVEVSDGQSGQVISATLQTALDIVGDSLGVRPGIATDAHVWDEVWGLGSAAAFANNPLWVENFTSNCPTVPAPWSNWALWQYSDSGAVTGITGPVDLDRSPGPALPICTGTLTLRLMLPPAIRS